MTANRHSGVSVSGVVCHLRDSFTEVKTRVKKILLPIVPAVNGSMSSMWASWLPAWRSHHGALTGGKLDRRRVGLISAGLFGHLVAMFDALLICTSK